ncbi:MAG TPA: cytochrome c peroxidase, partial [Bryobacteraceae bacterium]|nr:cytochrome c peroxidase [Bryobacteraceae bacterium]
MGAMVLLCSCAGPNQEQKQTTAVAPARPIGTPVEIKAPLGLPPVPIPPDNPPTAETIALGRRLYYDTAFSIDGTVSCASCHSPGLGFSDGRRVSTGVHGKTGSRNAPTVFNSAYFTVQFWDGRAPSLEKQAEGPVENPVEMAHTMPDVVKKLSADPTYVAAFEKAFGPGPVTYEKVEKCIASFERTVISGNSPFDKYYFGGDKKAMSPAAIRGLEVFRKENKGNCVVCHTIDQKFALFTDNKYHNLGVGINGKGELTDEGRFAISKMEADHGAFKTPSLRNIAQTAPYMHDGSLKTLEDVVEFYIGGGTSSPYRDKE